MFSAHIILFIIKPEQLTVAFIAGDWQQECALPSRCVPQNFTRKLICKRVKHTSLTVGR